LNQRRIFVLGSANMDLAFALGRMPRQGETISGSDLALFPGGKGANQACAAGRLGGRTCMVAHVGNDPFGPQLVESLRAAGVDVSRVGVASRPTGCACIYVLPNGENSIVISPGANATLDPETALASLADLTERDFLLAQLEIPLETVEAAFAHARTRGATTILDPAPARPLSSRLLQTINFLTPNQTEALMLLGEPDRSVRELSEAATAADRLAAIGPRAVILKLGELGSYYSNGRLRLHAEPFRVVPKDTTAAGDVFNGALAVALSEDRTVADALRFANAAAALSVTRRGAQTSVPTRSETEEMMSCDVSADH
jgi:ribokinase